jgi:hypothetical protein
VRLFQLLSSLLWADFVEGPGLEAAGDKRTDAEPAVAAPAAAEPAIVAPAVAGPAVTTPAVNQPVNAEPSIAPSDAQDGAPVVQTVPVSNGQYIFYNTRVRR